MLTNIQLPSGYSFTGLEMITATSNTDGTVTIFSIYPYDKGLSPANSYEVLRVDTIAASALASGHIITIKIIVS